MPQHSFEPTEEHRRQVEAMAGYGIPIEDIAKIILNPRTGKHIAKNTLKEHFEQELAVGHVKANSKVAESLYKQAVEGRNTTAAIWWTKTRMGWKERSELEINANVHYTKVQRTVVIPDKS
jgi:hypothetical protein